eukprot:TRINITY_DN9174_c0_g1_i1.p1 TRINITY_DN9174_c0_g1~~TRINITY_DN9174_c0_g1_i1.p1  ORF type:complete len:135 (+),score=14.81 TRINITY_DN9174_c0_g1_i1:169-573(+)
MYRVIFDFCTPKDQLSLSRTFHSMKWMESVWKEESMKQYQQLVTFSPKLFEMAIEFIGISWATVLECFSRPHEMQNSFRRYYQCPNNDLINELCLLNPLNGDNQDKTACFILGNIDDDLDRNCLLYTSPSPRDA